MDSGKLILILIDYTHCISQSNFNKLEVHGGWHHMQDSLRLKNMLSAQCSQFDRIQPRFDQLKLHMNASSIKNNKSCWPGTNDIEYYKVNYLIIPSQPVHAYSLCRAIISLSLG